ncbi:hypothetical protein SARC_14371 [Sphaeroforma arctica JP610]|uniref:Uncharacterized protein n=1 Tax=Sphaeroforma arctica JP610 TaxID=667725 RepID=A0A0L0F8M7_9EUKA|nr:hypothetical protein SARC_14371 [Sphaeroforma arctica JP610]KNC73069.1 hypothetical protein SARC_14371 [Sphaeroforma arctica JP610]|eukprot:XP_014146971.1 hypothetical protein SARC_14371 [Sphaeroforma arctica JP610]
MSGTVLVLNIPVLIMYLVLTFTQSVIADYVAVAYYCLLIAVMMLFTFKLWQKRGQLKQHQLSETKTLVIYGATLAFYVIFDNVRYYGFPDEMYGENASIWVTIDFVSFCCLSVVVLFIWARNIFIMWDRENNGSGHTTAGENTDRALGEEGTPIQNKWRRGRIDNATIDDVRYDTRLVPSSRVELEGDKVGGGTKDIDTLVKDHINAGIREKETDIEAGEASGDDGSGEDLTLNVSMTSAPWLRDRRDL